MPVRFSELRCKEVINVQDGCRLGYVTDLGLDCETGCVRSLIVPVPGRFFGLFGCAGLYVIPWTCIRRIGCDLILVDVCLKEIRQPKERSRFFS